MGENSGIEWCDHTFNPWIGCTKVSPACDHCYAEAWDKRFGGERWGPHAPRRRTKTWDQPVKWNREAAAQGRRFRVFCASLADVFDNHGSITSGWRGDLWHLIARTPHLDWLLLTKRPQNIAKMLPDGYGAPAWGKGWPNVWLGTTVENQEEADRRIPHLLKVPAAVRFLSCEPLLGPVDLTEIAVWRPELHASIMLDVMRGTGGTPKTPPGRLDWVIAGGESGPGARPMHPDWPRALRDQCAAAGVPFFFKQWGEWGPDEGPPAKGRDRIMEGAVPCATLGDDGWIYHADGFTPDPFEGRGRWLYRLGKKAAGAMLDGRKHQEFPA